MNVINYDKVMKQVIAEAEGTTPSLFLHACCAPCAGYPIELLHRYFDLCVYYYNPNITDEAEYELRYAELKRYIDTRFSDVGLIKGEFCPQAFFAAAKGLENVPEGGARCAKCFELRLDETARMAKAEGYDYFATTLTVSPLKNPDLINKIGQAAAEKHGVAYLVSDFKKSGGYQESNRISREMNFYRQNYCGCPFSKKTF